METKSYTAGTIMDVSLLLLFIYISNILSTTAASFSDGQFAILFEKTGPPGQCRSDAAVETKLARSKTECFIHCAHMARRFPGGCPGCQYTSNSEEGVGACEMYKAMGNVRWSSKRRCVYYKKKTTETECRDGWTRVEKHCCKIIQQLKTWDAAVNHCQQLHSALVTIDSEEKNTLVTSLRSSLGLNDLVQEGTWAWQISGKQTTYTSWDPAYNQPEGGRNENCVFIIQNSKGWHDDSCGRAYYFMCEHALYC